MKSMKKTMKTRIAEVKRATTETNIKIKLIIDGKGTAKVTTKIGFLDHLFETFARFGVFDVELYATGDLEVDQHHLVEDCGLVLGQAFREALGDKRGINRVGYFVFPMDESLSVVAVDISNRPYLNVDASFAAETVGGFQTELITDFFYGFSVGLQATIHVRMLSGRSDHHKIESIFKGFGKAMKMACSYDQRMLDDVPSTKGLL